MHQLRPGTDEPGSGVEKTGGVGEGCGVGQRAGVNLFFRQIAFVFTHHSNNGIYSPNPGKEDSKVLLFFFG
jgi:hypothetical protein